MVEMVYDPTTTIVLKCIDLLHDLVKSYVKLAIEFVGANGFEHLWVECNHWICLDARACGLLNGIKARVFFEEKNRIKALVPSW